MILSKLAATSSRLAKEAVLRDHSGDEMSRKMFRYAYDPDMMYFQRFDDVDWGNLGVPRPSMFEVLDLLRTRTVTGNTARNSVEHYASQYGDLIKLICNKDLDCGVTETTLNNVYGKGFIPTFSVQLATDVSIEKVRLPCLAQLKYNGTRVVTLIDSKGHSRLFTRSGKEFSYPKLQDEIARGELRNTMLDGELCFGDSCGHDHSKVSGIVNSSIKGTPIPSHHDLSYHVFDAMAHFSFYSQNCTNPYSARLNTARHLVKDIASCMVHIADSREVKTLEQVQELFQQRLAAGYEGLILKHEDHMYEFKRSKVWVKMKAEKTVTLVCKSIQPGEGKYSGGIGALVCHGVTEGKDVTVKVGSGLSDEDRMHTEEHEFLNKPIDVLYNTVIQDGKTGLWSLFLPRYICVRGDM